MKRKKLWITLLLCISLLGCGSASGTKGGITVSESESTQKSEAKSTEQVIEQNLESAGITDYEKLDLAEIEKEKGVALDDYLSYRFFYESDGLQIEAYISAPKSQIVTGKQSPCLIYNHGGNRNYSSLNETDTLYYAYNIGMICVATNYRGCGNSEGPDEFGGDDVDDVTKIVDLCEEFDYIDNSKINMLGISRGGMMTYEALKGNDKINKAVVISGLADAFMGYEERDDMKTLMKELIGSTPEEKPEEYEKRSATYWADEINTPLLIFHMTGDKKVSIEQAEKLTSLLSEYKKDYEYISFESDVHADLRQEDMIKIKKWLWNK